MENIQAKIEFMIRHGFKIETCKARKIVVLIFNDYAWTFNEVNETDLLDINKRIIDYKKEHVLGS